MQNHCDLILNERGSLWLGDCESAFDAEFLKSKGIRTVIQVKYFTILKSTLQFFSKIKKQCFKFRVHLLKLNLSFLSVTVASGLKLKLDGIVHHIIEILDSETANISQYFQIANEWIERGFNIGAVLVHCMAGISRSAAIVISYLIEKRKMNYNQALSFVKSKRPQINPNKGFSNQLQAFVTKVSQPPLSKNQRANNFQQNQEYYNCNYYAPINRKGSAGILQQNMNFYKSITKSLSQSKNKNK